MKKLILVIFTICLFSLPLLANGPYYGIETENNDTPAMADLVPIGAPYVFLNGTASGNDDWFEYCVYLGNHWDTIVVTIVAASDEGNLYVDVCTEDPLVVLHTLHLIGDTFSYVVANEDDHYIKVYATASGSSYSVKVENLNEATLPVVLSSFTGECNNGLVGLKWVTQSETDLSGYNVLRNESNSLASALQVNQGIISATNTSTIQQYTYEDQEVETNQFYYYWLESVNRDGSMDHYGPVTVSTTNPGGNDTPDIGIITGIEPAYPNPFSDATNLKFRLSSDMNVRLDIYNLKGEKIRTVYSGDLLKGNHSYRWDGKNDKGNPISSGLYLSRLTTPTGVFYSKLNLLK